MHNIFIIIAIFGAILTAAGLHNLDNDALFCEELQYKASLNQWKNYAKSLTSSQPMRKELELMNKEQFIKEMYVLYNLTLKD